MGDDIDSGRKALLQDGNASRWVSLKGGILGFVVGLMAYPFLQNALFKMFVTLRIFQETEANEGTYSNGQGQQVLIWSLFFGLALLYVGLFGSSIRRPKRGKDGGQRVFALVALIVHILLGGFIALMMVSNIND